MPDTHFLVPDAALDTLFLAARTRNGWQDRAVDPALLERAYDLAKMGPTAVNSSPLRVVFVTSAAGKERLKPALSAGNLAKTMAAPVTAIIAHDLDFPATLTTLFPHAPVAAMFTGNPALLEESAFRNGTLQAAYLLLALRSLGLDCGPMSGFDKAKVNAEFFPDGRWTANFLMNIGYGSDENLHPRLPRLSFEQACRFA